MSEYGEYEAGHETASLEAAHSGQGQELDHQSQYGILEQDHHSYEHEEFEQLKHIEYTDAAGNHYEITEYTHYEHTEVEDSHSLMAYGQESTGEAGFGEADGTDAGFGEAGFGESGFGAASAGSSLESITSRLQSFLGNGFDDASA
ncbi:hypothetical protein ACQP2P_11830 [Dactylosporangium sp. CA-139114]|uniref:hypothetical protein n=1 Tax=Dactylosporangium sp. CA-139114 TaxID=3239931 RepID=UPI003D964952